jgi:hypothetical protein
LCQRSRWELLLGALLAIASKPEGPVYVGVAALAAFVAGDLRRMLILAVGAASAFAVWLPTQRQLLHLPADGSLGWVAAAVGAIALVTVLAFGLDALLRQRRVGSAGRVVLVLALGLGGLLALPLVAQVVPANTGIGAYVHRGAQLAEVAARLPTIGWAFVDHTLLRVQFGLLFPLLIALVLRRGDRAGGSGVGFARAVALGPFVAFGLLSSALPFVLSPEVDIQHHLRSSLPRLLLHWIGPAWLWVGKGLVEPMPLPATQDGSVVRTPSELAG